MVWCGKIGLAYTERNNVPAGRLQFLHLGQDEEGELYVLTSMNIGPSGTTGEVLRLRGPRTDVDDDSDDDSDGDSEGED